MAVLSPPNIPDWSPDRPRPHKLPARPAPVPQELPCPRKRSVPAALVRLLCSPSLLVCRIAGTTRTCAQRIRLMSRPRQLMAAVTAPAVARVLPLLALTIALFGLTWQKKGSLAAGDWLPLAI